ncbi:MAG: hypothetical protein QM820_18710 [Minicystis sp.]
MANARAPAGAPPVGVRLTCYKTEARHGRRATWSEKTPDGRWRAYDYAELTARDKCSLDVSWLNDESLTATQNLPPLGGERAGDRRGPAGGAGAVAAELLHLDGVCAESRSVVRVTVASSGSAPARSKAITARLSTAPAAPTDVLSAPPGFCGWLLCRAVSARSRSRRTRSSRTRARQ